MGLIIFLIGLWLLIALIQYELKENNSCPKCNHYLSDSGYEGWKKWCPECGYRNYEGIIQ